MGRDSYGRDSEFESHYWIQDGQYKFRLSQNTTILIWKNVHWGYLVRFTEQQFYACLNRSIKPNRIGYLNWMGFLYVASVPKNSTSRPIVTTFFQLLEDKVRCKQCDQIGWFIVLWATFQRLWQQLFWPNHPHFRQFL